MSKKQFVLEMLEKLIGKRDLAKDFKRFLEMGALDNQAINALVELFRQMAVFVKNKKTKEFMLQAADRLEAMKQLELQETIKDQQEAEQLLLSIE